MSKKLQPAAFTARRSVPGRRPGSGASPTFRSPGSMNRSTTIARMRILREAGILPRMAALRSSAFFAFLLLVAACGTTPSAPPAPKETGQLVFWEIASAHPGGGHAWLLGSVHAGTPDLVFDPAIERAFAGSEALVIEADVTAIGGDGRGFV